MNSLERAFGDTERAAEAAFKAARGLSSQVRALERAAKTGNIAAIKREQSRLGEALAALEQEIQNAASAWPFSDEEVEQYLNEGYADELQAAAAGVGLRVYERDGNLFSYPSVLRVLPRENAVRVDRKKNSAIRPSHLAEQLLKSQTKTSGFTPARFLESLYSVYTGILSREDSGRLMKSTGIVVPLIKIYKLMTSLPGADREYDSSDFARDLYRLDAEGPRRTRRGATVSFPSSTGTRRRSSDLFTFLSPQGQTVTYYGIRFSEET
ncbi:MAG: hypothetical protein OXO48_05310 [Caldilineaceae bacterium]|nr:hypothetical protein [Caldilineaceae bacterium]